MGIRLFVISSRLHTASIGLLILGPPSLVMMGSLILTLIFGNLLGPPRSLLLFMLLRLCLPECPDAVCWAGKLADSVGDLPTAYERYDDGCAHNKSEDKAIHGVPARSPPTPSGTTVGVVEEVESQELGDKGVFDRHKDSGPGDSWGDDTDGIPRVSLGAAKTGPLQAPVDSTKE